MLLDKTLGVVLTLSLMLLTLWLSPVYAEDHLQEAAGTKSQKLTGVVVDHSSREGLKASTVVLLENDAVLEQQTVGEKGKFTFAFEYKNGSTYQLKASNTAYPDESVDLSLALEKNRLPERIEISMAAEDSSFTFRGNVLNRETKELVPGVRIMIVNTRSGEITQQESDFRGDYAFQVESGYEYEIVFSNLRYLTRYSHINYCSDALDTNNKYCFSGFFQPELDAGSGAILAKMLVDKVEIGKRFSVKDIYYDYNKATLRADALPNLRKLYHILDDTPQLVVELGSHADSRGSDDYNFVLSQQRADSAVNYIVEQGITGERIAAKGYGESVPLNRCINGVKCSDSEHAKNRRTEFIIIDIDESVFLD